MALPLRGPLYLSVHLFNKYLSTTLARNYAQFPRERGCCLTQSGWKGRGDVCRGVGADLTETPQLYSIWTLVWGSYAFQLPPEPPSADSQPEISVPTWHMKKLMLREGTDLSKVTTLS